MRRAPSTPLVRAGGLATAALLALALSAPVQAQAPQTGFYGAARIGMDIPESGDFHYSGAATDVDVRRDHGFVGLLAGGYDFGGFRSEIEIGYRQSRLSDFDFGQPAGIDTTGRQDTWTGMVNAYYDVDFGGISLFAGGGVGVAHATIDLGDASDSDTYFAWQGIAGAAYDLTPNLAVTGEYRYMQAFDDPSYELYGYGLSGADHIHHSALIGLRYTFGAAPAAAAVQDVIQARSYLVFFDFDSAALTADARAIVASAAQDALAGGSPRLDVTGHTDRSGSDAYNQALSIRRATTVQTELIANGVPADIIVIRGAGERENLVPTADGVREPQNRRVEIVIN